MGPGVSAVATEGGWGSPPRRRTSTGMGAKGEERRTSPDARFDGRRAAEGGGAAAEENEKKEEEDDDNNAPPADQVKTKGSPGRQRPRFVMTGVVIVLMDNSDDND